MPWPAAPVVREYVHPEYTICVSGSSSVITPTLRNCRKSSERAPSQSLIDRIVPGFYAKLATPDGIRFWARIDSIDGDGYVGTVANAMPTDMKEPLSSGDKIAFRSHHIYSLRVVRRQADA